MTETTNQPCCAEERKATVRQRTFRPHVDAWETDAAIKFAAELPGVGSDGIDVRLEERILTITGTPEMACCEGSRTANEVRRYKRVFRIPAEINADNITATINNGLLHVTLPKAEAAMPRRIEVNTT